MAIVYVCSLKSLLPSVATLKNMASVDVCSPKSLLPSEAIPNKNMASEVNGIYLRAVDPDPHEFTSSASVPEPVGASTFWSEPV